jgi:hypothetical protein
MQKEEIHQLIQVEARQTISSLNTDKDIIQDFSQEEPQDILLIPEEKPGKEETQEEKEVTIGEEEEVEEEDVLFIFSFAMYPSISVDELAESRMVAVWDPLIDMDNISLTAKHIPFHISTITRFKIVA